MNRLEGIFPERDDIEQVSYVLVGTLTAKLVREFSSIISVVVTDTDNGPHWMIMFKYTPALMMIPVPMEIFRAFFESVGVEEPSEEEMDMRALFMEKNYEALYRTVSEMEDEMIEDQYE